MIRDEPDTPILHILCPPQLHLNLGIAVHFVQAVERLDDDLCHEWKDQLGVTRDEKHGDTRTLSALDRAPQKISVFPLQDKVCSTFILFLFGTIVCM